MKKLLIGIVIGMLICATIAWGDKVINYTRTDAKMSRLTLNLIETGGVRNVDITACGSVTRSDGVVEPICETRDKAGMPPAVYADLVTFWNAMEPLFNVVMVDENANLYPVE